MMTEKLQHVRLKDRPFCQTILFALLEQVKEKWLDLFSIFMEHLDLCLYKRGVYQASLSNKNFFDNIE